jgi:hypothetical protein
LHQGREKLIQAPVGVGAGDQVLEPGGKDRS